MIPSLYYFSTWLTSGNSILCHSDLSDSFLLFSRCQLESCCFLCDSPQFYMWPRQKVKEAKRERDGLKMEKDEGAG